MKLSELADACDWLGVLALEHEALAPPLLQCSKCKAEAYCCKACQVPLPPRKRSARCVH